MSKAKDPAVLWYYRDYLSGTEEMSWAEQGAYSRLLNKQADKGHLSLESVKKILKKDFPVLWPAVSEKFLIDQDGNYYNERMDIEVAKRAKNSKAQKDRIQKYWDDLRNGTGSTTEYSTEDTTVIPIANANASKELKDGDAEEIPDIRHAGMVPEMVAAFKEYFPKYPEDVDKDFRACLAIAWKIADANNWPRFDLIEKRKSDVVKEWSGIVAFAANDKWFKKRSITDLNNEWQRLMQGFNGTEGDTKSVTKITNSVADAIAAARAKKNA